MKTNVLSFLFILLFALAFCPPVFSEEPPKKELGKHIDTPIIFRPIVSYRPIESYRPNARDFYPQEAGYYVVAIIDDSNQIVNSYVAYLDDNATAPFVPGFDIILIPITSYEQSPDIMIY